ncbi:hypothetical protein VUN82_10705 [Micrococcaceae bacterium Sec5.1]
MNSNYTSSVHGLRAVALPMAAPLAPMETVTSAMPSTAVSRRAGFTLTFVAWSPVGGLAV